MVLQLDDCVDCLKCLHPEFDYLFLFDHSCGHDRQREDGLNVENMSKSFGGKQSNLRDTLIKEEAGYLGTFPRILSPGDVQHMVFQPSNDPGPFWFNETEKEENRKDKVIDGQMTKQKLQKEELVKKLAEQGITAAGNLVQVQKLAREQNIPIIKENVPKIKEGWETKPKGLLQVLWERGFIDASNLKQYTMDG